mgnify:CR=1 FL=1
MTPDIQQAELKKAYIAASLQTIIMFDSSKVGKISFVEFAKLQDINKLVTDSGIDSRIRKYLDDNQDTIQVLYA